MAEETRHPVAVESGTWHRDEAWRNIVRSLRGTWTMRAAKETHLPPFASERRVAGNVESEYQRRLATAVVFAALPDAVESNVGKVFAKPIVLGKDVPATLAEWCEDIDLLGNNLEQFFKSRFAKAWEENHSWVLVEMPPAIMTSDGKVAEINKEQEKAAGRRAWLTAYDAGALIGSQVDQKNKTRFAMRRLREDVEVPDGACGNRISKRIRVLRAAGVAWPAEGAMPAADAWTTGSFEVWEEVTDATSGKITWALLTPRTPTPGMTEIPLVKVPCGKDGDEPPFLELCYWNIRDWQMQSNLDLIESVANVPKAIFTGLDVVADGGAIATIPWGPTNALKGPIGSDGKWMELQGLSIPYLKNSMDAGRNIMRAMALEPLQPKAQEAAESETADELRGARANSVLQSGALGLQDAIEQCLLLMAQWSELGDDGGEVEVKVNTKFTLTKNEQASLEHLRAMREGRDLSRASYWAESQRFGVPGENFDPKKEEGLLAAEAEKERTERPPLVGTPIPFPPKEGAVA